MVEQKPSKLKTRVRFPSPAPESFDAGVVATKASVKEFKPDFPVAMD